MQLILNSISLAFGCARLDVFFDKCLDSLRQAKAIIECPSLVGVDVLELHLERLPDLVLDETRLTQHERGAAEVIRPVEYLHRFPRQKRFHKVSADVAVHFEPLITDRNDGDEPSVSLRISVHNIAFSLRLGT